MQTGEVVDTIAKACAYGDYDKLRAFVEADPGSVNVADEQGYHPLQWAALNNRVVETNFLLSQGAQVNASDTTGQTALHWAAVRGSLPCIETLLRNGADPNVADNRGYTACHVAAQYGQTAVLYHLALKWGIDCDTTDNDGRTALHWAAYKGFADSVRLLLVLDARYALADKEGCTPLHWAAIKGNGEACTVLVQGGALSTLSARDVTGSTPPQLAVEKGHRYLGMHLQEVKARAEDAWFGKNGTLAWMNRTQLCPIIWILVLGLLLIFVTKVIGGGPIHLPQQHPGTNAATSHSSSSSSGVSSLSANISSALAAAEAAAKHAAATLGSQQTPGTAGMQPQAGSSGAGVSAAAVDSPVTTDSALSSNTRLIFAANAHAPGGSSSSAVSRAFFNLMAWSVVVAAGVGLVFLHKTTTSDPGFIPTGRDGGRTGEKQWKAAHAAAAAAAAGGGSGPHSHNSLLAGGTAGGSIERSAGTAGGGGAGAGGGTAGKGSLLRSRSGDSSSHGCSSSLLDSPALWCGNWHQLCVTCKIVRPLRAKHCAVTDRCVEVFDHYCPWVGNTIGKGNRHFFLVFLWLELYALLVSCGVAVTQLRSSILANHWSGQLVWILVFLVISAFVSISVAVLAVAQASQVARNVTTNELANWHRYKYLQDASGGFSNPFNRGVKLNCWEAFHPQSTPMAPVMVQRDPEGLSGLGLGDEEQQLPSQVQGHHSSQHAGQHRHCHGPNCRH